MLDMKGMTLEEVRALRAKVDEEERRLQKKEREEGEEQILEIAARNGIDLAKLAQRLRVYRNPDDPWGKPWDGRGRRPAWLQKKLAEGHTLDEFEVRLEANDATRGTSAGPAAG